MYSVHSYIFRLIDVLSWIQLAYNRYYLLKDFPLLIYYMIELFMTKRRQYNKGYGIKNKTNLTKRKILTRYYNIFLRLLLTYLFLYLLFLFLFYFYTISFF